MKRISSLLVLLIVFTLLTFTSVFAQDYSFNLSEGTVDLFLNGDGTARIEYTFVFQNDPAGAPIEYVDVAFPSYTDVDVNSISATIDGQPVSYISTSEYEGDGSGVAVALGSNAVPPGGTGTVKVVFGNVTGLVFQDSQDANYASTEFSPAYFKTAHGDTIWTVNIHLPVGVTSEEGRWHGAPGGWSEQPETYLDTEGRVTYSWTNAAAGGNKEYKFGASYPSTYLPAGTVQQPDVAQSLGTDWGTLTNIGIWACCIGFFAIVIGVAYTSGQKRKLQYLPPKIAIEGNGIKRGLTAVEAAILLEQSLDKVLTMILFGVVKKGAATVAKQDPLELQIDDPLPTDLQPYEREFLQAFKGPAKDRKTALQAMMIELVKGLSSKMKGFSRKETIAYYRDIVQRAWTQVETAGTPEVKSEKFEQNLEWTMLDKDYDDRTRRVFDTGPVFVPTWWPRYDPGYGRTVSSAPTTTSAPSGGSGGGGLTMPTLPGSAFAGSIVGGVQSFSSKVVGNISDFTSSITNKTNPVPVSTSTRSGGSGGGHSGGCACACACAGCACACAGGGR